MSLITMRIVFPAKLRPIVYALQNLDRNFANLVAPPTDGYAHQKDLIHFLDPMHSFSYRVHGKIRPN